MQTTQKKTGKRTRGFAKQKSYLKLLESYPPRPITSEAELRIAQEKIDSLIDRDHLTGEEQAYLNVLGTLVREYEEKYEPMPDLHGVELLRMLLSEHKLRQRDLVPIFKTESIVSAVLNGQRKLTTAHIQKLAQFFHLSPSAFFERSSG